MSKRVSQKEKNQRWLELQKSKMQERIHKQQPVFDGYEIKLERVNPRYGDIPEQEENVNAQQ